MSSAQTLAEHNPNGVVPTLEVVDPSIFKKAPLDKLDVAKEAEGEQAARLERIAKATAPNTLVYVFDEFVIRGTALDSALKLVAQAFPYVSPLPLHKPAHRSAIGRYIPSYALPFRRDPDTLQLTPNKNSIVVESVMNDMRTIGQQAAKNLMQYYKNHPEYGDKLSQSLRRR